MGTNSENELAIIGAGFGRTGTLSMRAALGFLGLGPVHHMFEVVKAPEQSSGWLDALEDSSVLKELLADYRSAVDWPSCYFWKELMVLYPGSEGDSHSSRIQGLVQKHSQHDLPIIEI